jgi:tRNA pseudouridine13 synthase
MEPPSVEREVGMEVYLTSSPGIGGKMRVYPEDFVVEELSLPPARVEGGQYTAARLRARNWETNRLVRELSRALGISRKRIAFAGTKDKRGVKVQFLTFRDTVERVLGLRLQDLEVLEAYPTDRPLELGHLLGNRFEIRLRGAAQEGLAGSLQAVTGELEAAGGIPNFFGIQRFGAVRPVTHIIGRSLVKSDFEGAVMGYLGNPTEAEEKEVQEARSRLEKDRDFAAAENYFPQHLSFERSLIQHMRQSPGDWTGALRRFPLNLLMMFVHAYQSKLFNRMLSRRLREGLPLGEPRPGDVVLPVDDHGRPDHDHYIRVEEHNLSRIAEKVRAGRAHVSGLLFGSEIPFADGKMGEIERAIVDEEGLRQKDFFVPELPEVSSKGTRRELMVRPGDFSVELEKDAAFFRFSLHRGCYATALMREYMKGQVLDY